MTNKLEQLDWWIGRYATIGVVLVAFVAGILLDELVRYLYWHLIWMS